MDKKTIKKNALTAILTTVTFIMFCISFWSLILFGASIAYGEYQYTPVTGAIVAILSYAEIMAIKMLFIIGDDVD